MNSVINIVLFAAVSVAHSGVWSVDVDGVNYPAYDTRLDGKLGAERIEWSFRDNMDRTWAPVERVDDQALACGRDAKPPQLKAVARAGANVTVQWSGIVRTHYGPTMNYLAYSPAPNAKPQNLSFFKIDGHGYENKLWANEALVNNDRKETFQLPSDIKPGTYVLRTELLSLHYATKSGPQFYNHCFNVEIKGDGTASPPGVTFPGAYKATDPSLKFSLYDNGKENNWESYVIPGPPKYAGKYDAPKGSAPVVSEKDRGLFPKEFQVKYEIFKKKWDAEALEFNDKLNNVQKDLHHKQVDFANESKLFPVFREHAQKQASLNAELAQLRQERIALGAIIQ